MVEKVKKKAKALWNKFLGLSTVKKTLIMCGVSVLIIILRRPELIFHPQFWAEDFAVFFRDAYIREVPSLVKPYSGSLQLFPRVIALIFAQLPLNVAPLFFNISAMAVMVLPVFLIWSDNNLLKSEGPNRKLLITALYLLMPNIAEIYGNLSNATWFLTIAAILVLIRTDKKSAKKWLPFDIALLVASCLTGPTSIVLAIVATYLALNKATKSRPAVIKAVVVAACAIVQITVFMVSAPAGPSIVHQAKPVVKNYSRAVELTGVRFIALPIVGKDLVNSSFPTSPQAYALGVITIILSLTALLKVRTEIKALIIFCALVYALSLLRAQTEPIIQFWRMLQLNLFGERYFFVPFFGWLVALVCLTKYSKTTLSKIATTIIAAFLIFFPFYFSVPKLKDYNFTAHAKAFQNLDSKEEHCFPMNPNEAWTTCLKKK